MLFILSKTAGALFLLPNFLTLLGSIGLILSLTRYASLGRKLVASGFVGLVVCGITPLGALMLIPLEERFQKWKPPQGEPDGIVVLGGGIDPDISAARQVPVPVRGIDRLIVAAKLAREYPRARVIYSSGSPNLIDDTAREADYALDLFAALGISQQRITVERNSRNTLENAEFSKAIAAPRHGERWLLVTSAAHTPRAIGLFRRAGFLIEPVPADWRTEGKVILSSVSFDVGIQRVMVASREWIGLTAYWIMGKTSELFPRH